MCPSRNYWATSFVALLLASCAETGPKLAHVFSSEHFDYFVEEGLEPPCPEILEGLERLHESFSGYLGAELPEGERFTYVYGSTALVRRECGGFDRCQSQGAIYSVYTIDRHEVVHAHNWLLGWAPSLFNEGLAEVLGCSQVFLDQEFRWAPEELRAVLTSSAYRAAREDDPLATQLKAMGFVRYLLDHYGKESFMSFYRSFPSVEDLDSTEGDIEERFFAAFGESMDAVAGDWYVAPRRGTDELCLYLPECEHFEAMDSDSAELALSCGYWGLTSTVRYSAVQPILLERDESVLMRVNTDDAVEQVTFHVKRCEGGAATTFPLGFGYEIGRGRRAGVLRLPAGRYFATISSREPATVDFQATPLTRDVPACGAERDPVLLSQDEDLLVYRRWIEDEACDGPSAAPWCPGGVSLDFIPTVDGELLISIDGPPRTDEQNYYLCDAPCASADGELQCVEEVEIDREIVGAPLEEPLVNYRRLTAGEQVRVAVGPTTRELYPRNFSNMRITVWPTDAGTDGEAISP